MAVTVTVTVRCQAQTQRHTQCTKEATVYDLYPSDDKGAVELVKAEETTKRWTEHMGGKYYTSTHAVQGFHFSNRFVCDTHSIQGRNGRAKKAYANHGING